MNLRPLLLLAAAGLLAWQGIQVACHAVQEGRIPD